MQNARALTNLEFFQAFNASRPPPGWGERIGVAVSGGPDSIALLFLLQQLLKEKRVSSPSSLVAFTVDHGLRRGSADEAASVQRTCRAMGADHRLLTLPWGLPPFPLRPSPGTSFEEIARRARYHGLLLSMVQENVTTLVIGHHADDQVETAVMRSLRNSGETGLAGMRSCRRYGMGDIHEGLGRFGAVGMRLWMSRPLLAFPKTRILATCEEHNLTYVIDESNSDPNATIRNSLRKMLSGIREPGTVASVPQPLQAVIARALKPAREKGERIAALYNWVGSLAQARDNLDVQATTFLSLISVDSPVSTFTIDLSRRPASRELEIAVIIRILRYVSCRPWGHPSAEAARRGESLHRTAESLWGPQEQQSPSFISGSGVLWTRTKKDVFGVPRTCWIASREPPRRAGVPDLTVDLDPYIRQALATRHVPVTFLWDNRFLVTLNGASIPHEIMSGLDSGHRIFLKAHGKWFLPTVSLYTLDSDRVLASMNADGTTSSEGPTTWAAFQWIRSLDAI